MALRILTPTLALWLSVGLLMSALTVQALQVSDGGTGSVEGPAHEALESRAGAAGVPEAAAEVSRTDVGTNSDSAAVSNDFNCHSISDFRRIPLFTLKCCKVDRSNGVRVEVDPFDTVTHFTLSECQAIACQLATIQLEFAQCCNWAQVQQVSTTKNGCAVVLGYPGDMERYTLNRDFGVWCPENQDIWTSC